MVEFEYLGTCFFFIKPLEFLFFTVYMATLGNSRKNSASPVKIPQILWHPLEIPRPKPKTFHIFSEPFFFFTLEIPLHLYLIAGISTFFSSMHLEIPCSNPPCLDFCWNSPTVQVNVCHCSLLAPWLRCSNFIICHLLRPYDSLLGERRLIIYENVDVNEYQLPCGKSDYTDLLLLVLYLL